MLNRIQQKLNTRNASEKVSFWFVRHGESEGNLPGSSYMVNHNAPITKIGIVEAQLVAKYLKDNTIPVTAIYTSPLQRAHKTAEIIAKELNLTVQVKEGLEERDWGILGNLSWDVVSEKLSQLNIEERFTFVPEGGESWQQMEERLTLTLEEIAEDNDSGDNILIVTHRGCLRAILPMLAKASRDKHADFSVKTGSLSKFTFSKEQFDFVGLNPAKLTV